MSADDPVTNVISLHDWRMEEASLINERITCTHRPSVKIKNYLSCDRYWRMFNEGYTYFHIRFHGDWLLVKPPVAWRLLLWYYIWTYTELLLLLQGVHQVMYGNLFRCLGDVKSKCYWSKMSIFQLEPTYSIIKVLWRRPLF